MSHPARLRAHETRREACVRHADRARAACERELAWLDGTARDEPPWPNFPTPVLRESKGISMTRAAPSPRPVALAELVLEPQVAALWLGLAGDTPLPHGAVGATSLTVLLVRAYSAWTAAANGLGHDAAYVLARAPDAWNARFYGAAPHAAEALGPAAWDEFVEQMTQLPDRSFYIVARIVVREADVAYFGRGTLALETALALRGRIIARLVSSAGWRREASRSTFAAERHLTGLLAPLFMNDQGVAGMPGTYLLAAGAARAGPFLPQLQQLFGAGPASHVAVFMMNVLEARADASDAPLLLDLAARTLERVGIDSALWVEHGLGEKIALRVTGYFALYPAVSELPGLVNLLDALVSAGVNEAAALEARMATANPSRGF